MKKKVSIGAIVVAMLTGLGYAASPELASAIDTLFSAIVGLFTTTE